MGIGLYSPLMLPIYIGWILILKEGDNMSIILGSWETIASIYFINWLDKRGQNDTLNTRSSGFG